MNTTGNMTNQRVTTSASLGSTPAVSHAGLLQRARWGYQIIIKGVFATLIFPIIVTLSMMLTTSTANALAGRDLTVNAGTAGQLNIHEEEPDDTRNGVLWSQVDNGAPDAGVDGSRFNQPRFTAPASLESYVLIFNVVETMGGAGGPEIISTIDTVTVTVTGSDPSAGGATMYTLIGDRELRRVASTQNIMLSDFFSDLDSNMLTYVATSATEAVVRVSILSGVLTIRTVDPVVTGSTSEITVTARDGNQPSVTQAFTVTIGDSATTFTYIDSQILTLATGTVTIDMSGNFDDADVPNSQHLTYEASSARDGVMTVTITSAGVLTITPVSVGASIITVMAREGNNMPASLSVGAYVVDSPTTFTPIGDRTLAGGAVTIDVSGFAADADVLNSPDLIYTATSATQGVVAVRISPVGLLTITPVAVGMSVITVSAQDGTRPLVVQTFTVTVPAFDLNVDGSEQTDVSDGLMIIRYIAGTRGGGDLTVGLSVASPDDVAAKIKRGIDSGLLNVDGSAQTDVSDGLMIIRYIAGTRGGGDLTVGLSVADPDDVADNIGELLP